MSNTIVEDNVVDVNVVNGTDDSSDCDTSRPFYRDGSCLVLNDPAFMGPPMKFSMQGVRVESGGDPNKPIYDANVDIVNIMPYALEQVIWMLISTRNCPMVDEVADANSVTVPELEKTYKCFCETLDYFTGPEARSTIDEAAKASGYTERPAIEKLLVEGMLSRCLLSFYWFGIRNRTAKSELPTIPPAYNRYSVIRREIIAALDGIETDYARKVKAKFGVVLNDDCSPIVEEEDDV